MSVIWNLLLVNPILNLLVLLYSVTDNLAVSIVLLTILIRTLLIPVMAPSLKNMQKQRDLQPEFDKLKEKYKYDKQKLAQEQMNLLKTHGLNPASGCLTQIAMIIVLIALYNVISKMTINVDANAINNIIYFSNLKFNESFMIDSKFWYMDLGSYDPYYILPVLGGIFQFFASKMMMPYVEKGEESAKKTPDKSDDIAYNMQEQMLYLMPIMTVVIGAKLPSGVALYILTTTIFSVIQQYYVSGWGGMKPWIAKLRSFAQNK